MEGQGEFTRVYRHNSFRIQFFCGFQCFFGQTVYGLPGHIILAVFQYGQVYGTKSLTNGFKAIIVSAIPTQKDLSLRGFQQEG
ncbi:hypothetical protein D3C71_1728630 [compost metagenome]